MAAETVITIIGNLTADPELRTTGQGAQVASFTIANTSRVYNKQTGQYEDGATLFMRCSAWRDMASHCARSLAKGMRVIAQGRLTQRSYQAQDGTNRTVVELQVDEIGPSLRYATAQVAYVVGASAEPMRHAGGGGSQIEHALDGVSLLKHGQLLTLRVLRDHGFELLERVEVEHEAWDGSGSGLFACGEPAVAGDDTVAAAVGYDAEG